MSYVRLFLFFIMLAPFMTSCSHASKVEQSKKNNAISTTKNKHRGSLIVLDPGHGGFDTGAACHSCEEKTLALSTALLTKKYLNELGYKVVMTRTRDIFIPLKKRATIANTTNGKLFLSLHYNSEKATSASGIEVFFYDSKNKWKRTSSEKLAKNILSRMLDRTGAPSRGVKTGNFHVLRETKMPSILIEGGFITHDKERSQLTDIKYQEQIAKAIAEGVDVYLKSI